LCRKDPGTQVVFTYNDIAYVAGGVTLNQDNGGCNLATAEQSRLSALLVSAARCVGVFGSDRLQGVGRASGFSFDQAARISKALLRPT